MTVGASIKVGTPKATPQSEVNFATDATGCRSVEMAQGEQMESLLALLNVYHQVN
jgi:hypothetical protein